MERLEEQAAGVIRAANAALCIVCMTAITRADPHATHHALSGLALLDEFSYAVRCSRCGTENPLTLIVGPHILDRTA